MWWYSITIVCRRQAVCADLSIVVCILLGVLYAKYNKKKQNIMSRIHMQSIPLQSHTIDILIYMSIDDILSGHDNLSDANKLPFKIHWSHTFTSYLYAVIKNVCNINKVVLSFPQSSSLKYLTIPNIKPEKRPVQLCIQCVYENGRFCPAVTNFQTWNFNCNLTKYFCPLTFEWITYKIADVNVSSKVKS